MDGASSEWHAVPHQRINAAREKQVVSGLTAMGRRGVHIKCSAFLETIGKLKALAVDKTGTIRPSTR